MYFALTSFMCNKVLLRAKYFDMKAISVLLGYSLYLTFLWGSNNCLTLLVLYLYPPKKNDTRSFSQIILQYNLLLDKLLPIQYGRA